MINLESPITVVVQPERTVQLSEINLLQIKDNPNEKIVKAEIENVGSLILWEGTAYDNIGDWTQEQAEERIVELLSA